MDYLDLLESEAVFIIRETAAQFRRPALLFSGGKDSTVLVRLAEKAFRPAISLILIAALFVCQIAIRLGSDLNHDTAWFLYVAQGMLDGGELYRDFVEVNPPLAIWLTVPIVMLSRATEPGFEGAARRRSRSTGGWK